MAVTLEWVRDNYDTNKSRYIEGSENDKADVDWNAGTITMEQRVAVMNAYTAQTLLPAYTTTEFKVSDYDFDGSCHIEWDELIKAFQDRDAGLITDAQAEQVNSAYLSGEDVCVENGGIDPDLTTPDTRTLEDGRYNIVVTINDYDTVYAEINVSGGIVSCINVTGVTGCGTGYPRVEASGTSVKVYMAKTTAVSDMCSWITSIGGWRNLQWTSHVLEAYYVYIGATGHSVGFSPVTWNDVLALYYYYIGDLSSAESKSGCGFT